MDTDSKKQLLKTTKTFFIVLFLVTALFFAAAFTIRFTNSSSNSESVSPGACIRSQPYSMAPEFERARNLRIQRLEEAGYKLDRSFYNCIDIQYADLQTQEGEGVEGLFKIDENSTIDHLTILVDNSYHARDDLLTAILLSHEFVHISQFVNEIKEEKRLDCIQSEVEAFSQELNFMTRFNEEEKRSLITRVTNYQDDKYRTILNLLEFSGRAQKVCGWTTGQSTECPWREIKRQIENMVRSNPYYQQQCNL